MDKGKKEPNELRHLTLCLTRLEDGTLRKRLRSESIASSVQTQNVPEQASSSAKEDEKHEMIPGQRKRRRGDDLFMEKTDSKVSEKSSSKRQKAITPAKRNRRLFSTPVLHSANDLAPAEKQGDALSQAVGLNCKLTNEVLTVKKQLFEKGEDLLKMQQKFYEKDLECKNVLGLVATKDAEIAELKLALEKMRAEHFCDDLIKFEDIQEVPPTVKSNLLLISNTERVDQDLMSSAYDEKSGNGDVAKSLSPQSINESVTEKDQFAWTPIE